MENIQFQLPSKKFIIVKKGTTQIESRYYHETNLFDGLDTSDPHYEVPTEFELSSIAVRFDENGTIEFYKDETLHDAFEADLLEAIRKKRNTILSSCDWTRLDDVGLSSEQKDAWAIYRQQLRDFPSTCDIYHPDWPVPPS